MLFGVLFHKESSKLTSDFTHTLINCKFLIS